MIQTNTNYNFIVLEEYIIVITKLRFSDNYNISIMLTCLKTQIQFFLFLFSHIINKIDYI